MDNMPGVASWNTRSRGGNMMKMHKSITQERVVDAVESEMFGMDNPGFCLACGADHGGCEPDARYYECEECEEHQVFGAAEVLMMRF